MAWFDILAVAVIVGWACTFLVRRWRARRRADAACGHCDNADCGES